MVCKNDPTTNHDLVEGVPNLQVMQLMRSFESKRYIRRRYAWRHHYYYLTNEGIEFLREYLHLPSEIVPATLRKDPRVTRDARPGRDAGAPAGGMGRGAPAGGMGRGRSEYRKTDTKTPAPAEFAS